MRQPGALPVWLIAEAIHHRRSGSNDRPTYSASQPTTSATTRKSKSGKTKIQRRILLTCSNKLSVGSKTTTSHDIL